MSLSLLHWSHRFAPVAVDLVEVRHVFPASAPAPETIDVHTRVLFRCGCGDVRVEELRGRWTLEQIKGGGE